MDSRFWLYLLVQKANLGLRVCVSSSQFPCMNKTWGIEAKDMSTSGGRSCGRCTFIYTKKAGI